MKARLRRSFIELYHFFNGEQIPAIHYGLRGDCSKLQGDCSGLRGDCSGLQGDCSGLQGDCSGLWGNCSGLWGDCSGLRGDCSGLRGNCSGLQGDLDQCEITDKEREQGLYLSDLEVEVIQQPRPQPVTPSASVLAKAERTIKA